MKEQEERSTLRPKLKYLLEHLNSLIFKLLRLIPRFRDKLINT
jgi:hypothetical protein